MAPSGEGLAEARADISNWRRAPHSRWAFANVRRIMPVADIAAAPEAPWPLTPAPRSLDGFRLARPDRTTLDLDGFLKATATDALVILVGGEIVFETYGPETGPHTPHILKSASKSVTGLLAGALAGRGLLDVEAPVSRYVPEIAAGPWAGARVRDLLDMRTGVVLGEAEAAYAAATGWEPLPEGAPPPSLHGFFAGLSGPPAIPHGGPFAYVSANTDLLAWVMERATGRRFADLLGEFVWRPMGAEDEAYVTVDAEGAARATGGVCASPRDFARLGRLVAEGGRRDGAEVVPAGWIADIQAGGDREAWRTGAWGAAFAPISPDMSYRSGWYLRHETPGWLFAMGVHGQNLFVDPARRLVIAKLSSQAEFFDYGAAVLTHAAIGELRRVVTGEG